MAKSKEGREEEFHKSIIRQQNKEIKRLNQNIRQLEKQLGYDQYKSPKSQKATKNDVLDECPSCGKGTLKTNDYGVRKITTCSLRPDCNYKKVSK